MTTDTWVQFKLTRRFDGTFHLYMDNRLVTPYGIATNPFVDANHLYGSHLIADMCAQDCLSDISHRWGECL